MRIDVLSLYPEIFSGYVSQPVFSEAASRNMFSVVTHGLGDSVASKAEMIVHRRSVGKLLRGKPVIERCKQIQQLADVPGQIVLLTPVGKQFDQSVARSLCTGERLILLCGRFAGFEPIVRKELRPTEISVGDFVLLGGEVAAMVVMDTLIRLIPGVIDGGKE